MKPALSLVFFTVLSGAGFGLAVFLALFPPPAAGAAAAATSLALVAGGLGASVLHLANPKNAWRAVLRVRTSWLSREAVLAACFFPLLAGGGWLGFAPLLLAAALCALLTVYCTAMIYQSLKTIPQWHHPLTAFNYLALALFSGGAVHQLFARAADAAQSSAALALAACLLAALAGKCRHYQRIGKCEDISIGAATNHSRAHVRLLDAGHTGETFLTQEFIYHCPAETLRQRRRWALALMFAPAALLAALALFAAPVPLLAALPLTILTLAGLLLERWLFFAEARHSVRAYHGG